MLALATRAASRALTPAEAPRELLHDGVEAHFPDASREQQICEPRSRRRGRNWIAVSDVLNLLSYIANADCGAREAIPIPRRDRSAARDRPRASHCARPCPGRPGAGCDRVISNAAGKRHPMNHRNGQHRTSDNATRRDHYTELTNQVIAALEAGAPP